MDERNKLYERGLEIMSQHGYSESKFREEFKKHVSLRDDEELACNIEDISCDESYPYRSIDGSCNNLGNPVLGMTFTKMVREGNARYADNDLGIPTGGFTTLDRTSLRKRLRKKGGNNEDGDGGKDGKCRFTINTASRPNARLVSTTIHPDLNVTDSVVTHMLTQWGQFLDHDIT